MKGFIKVLAFVTIIIIALSVVSFTSLLTFPYSNEESGNINKSDIIVIGYTMQGYGDPYYEYITSSMLDYSRELGIEFIFKDSKYSIAEQIEDINEFIDMKVAAIVISSYHPNELNRSIVKAIDMGIKIISLNQNIDIADVNILIDDYQSGYMGGTIAGDWINEKIADNTINEILDNSNKIQIMLNRYDQFETLKQRAQGLSQGLIDTYSGEYDLVFVEDAYTTEQYGFYSITHDTLQRIPNACVFLGINDFSAYNTYQVCLRNKNRNINNTCIVSVGGLDKAYELIVADTMYKGVVDIKPREMGQIAIDSAVNQINNKISDNVIVLESFPISLFSDID